MEKTKSHLRLLQSARGLLQRGLGKLLKPGQSLKWRTIQSSLVTFGGDLCQHGLRLAGNLIMTRLLYPEAFGLMLIVNLLMTGLEMLSDVGVRNAVILHSHNQERKYLNTAWTMLIVRGVLMTLFACALAAPIAHWKGEPILFGLILVSSFSVLIKGFGSPNGLIYERDVKMGRVVGLEVFAQAAGLVLSVTWLLIYPTIWALAAHGVLVAAIATGLSYVVFKGERPRFFIDRKIAKQIFNFGKWIFLSTALSFLAYQGDRLLMSNWLDVDLLGIFGIAATFSALVESVLMAIGYNVLFQVYAELKKSGAEKFNKQQIKVKAMFYLAAFPAILFFSIFGDLFIEFLYDPRYHAAGWMLQVLAVGAIFIALSASMIPVPLSYGNSFLHMALQAYRLAMLFVSMTVGGMLAGIKGLICGISVAPLLYYPVLLMAVRRYGIKVSWVDLLLTLIVLALIAVGWEIRGWPLASADG